MHGAISAFKCVQSSNTCRLNDPKHSLSHLVILQSTLPPATKRCKVSYQKDTPGGAANTKNMGRSLQGTASGTPSTGNQQYHQQQGEQGRGPEPASRQPDTKLRLQQQQQQTIRCPPTVKLEQPLTAIHALPMNSTDSPNGHSEACETSAQPYQMPQINVGCIKHEDIT